MDNALLAAIDQGTSSTRCILFDRTGKIVSKASAEHKQHFPQPGYVEHDPESIVECIHQVTARALEQIGRTKKDVAALGITNQRETIVTWDKITGKPLDNAIVWEDTRSREIVYKLNPHAAIIHHITGLIPSTYTGATKIRWFIENKPHIAKNPQAVFGTIDSWLAFKLTGKHITDVTNASRTGLMDLQTLDYDPHLCDLFGVKPEQLPTIMPSGKIFGEILNGPLEGVPLAALIGDQHASLIGQGCIYPGEIKNTYGTGNFLLKNTGEIIVPSTNNLITTVAYHIEGQKPVYALEGSVAVSGSLIGWLKNNLGLIDSVESAEHIAATVQDTGGVYIVPAFSGLFAPYWRTDARGIIVGLTHYTTRAHIVRAALESAALQTYDVFAAMNNDTRIAFTQAESLSHCSDLRVDGGMSVNSALMQFQADLLATEVSRPKNHEITAFGAGFMAGLSVDIYKDISEVKDLTLVDQSYAPQMKEIERNTIIRDWHKAVERSLEWIEEDEKSL